MKNIEKLRANSLTLDEAEDMADTIVILSVKAQSLDMALSSVSRQYRLRIAQAEEDGAWLGHLHSKRKMDHLILLRKIREWEVLTGQRHEDLLDGKEAMDADL